MSYLEIENAAHILQTLVVRYTHCMLCPYNSLNPSSAIERHYLEIGTCEYNSIKKLLFLLKFLTLISQVIVSANGAAYASLI